MSRIGCLGLAFALVISHDVAFGFEEKNRAEFATGTSFGSIALAGTSARELDRNFFKVLGSCETLEKNKQHYFVINHRDEEKAQRELTGYFFIETVLLLKQPATDPSSVAHVKLYRNDGWFDQEKSFELVLDRPRDISFLYEVHSAADGATRIPGDYKRWHARSRNDAKSSFEQSGYRVKPGHSSFVQTQNYLLIKAAATEKKRSTKIPSFNFQAGNAESGIIRISGPEFALEPVEYRVVFGASCS